MLAGRFSFSLLLFFVQAFLPEWTDRTIAHLRSIDIIDKIANPGCVGIAFQDFFIRADKRFGLRIVGEISNDESVTFSDGLFLGPFPGIDAIFKPGLVPRTLNLYILLLEQPLKEPTGFLFFLTFFIW